VVSLLRDLDAPADGAALAPLVRRRAAREPLALILGHREFWSLDLAVSSPALIPRPESETLIEAALAAFAGREPPRTVLDLGTGTGCLLLAALTEFPQAHGIGVDCSAEAARLAARNAAALHLAERARFVCADWADALVARFDLVLCNPPYIRSADIAQLMPEVARYEPLAALDGGPDGLAVYRDLLPRLPALLTCNGVAVLELGVEQGKAAAAMAWTAGLAATMRSDLAGTPRALVLRMP